LEKEGDDAALAKAWRFVVLIHGTACQYRAAEEGIRHVIDHARAVADRRQETRILPSYALAALYGPTPVPVAIDRCLEVVQLAAGDRRAEAWGLAVLSVLNAMQGRFDQARDLYRRSRSLFEELGQRLLASQISLFSGRVEMLAEDFVAAERELRRDFDALTGMGEKYFLANVAPLLAQAVYLQGRYEEAEELSRIGEGAATEDDIEAQALWRRAQAKVLARRGQFEEAERLAREAMGLIEDTDGLDLQANTLMDLAEVLQLASRPDAAVPIVREALRLHEEKGNEVSASRALRVLDLLGAEGRVKAPSP
jgi:tetratricopeptide (TPR) repeat protein